MSIEHAIAKRRRAMRVIRACLAGAAAYAFFFAVLWYRQPLLEHVPYEFASMLYDWTDWMHTMADILSLLSFPFFVVLAVVFTIFRRDWAGSASWLPALLGTIAATRINSFVAAISSQTGNAVKDHPAAETALRTAQRISSDFGSVFAAVQFLCVILVIAVIARVLRCRRVHVLICWYVLIALSSPIVVALIYRGIMHGIWDAPQDIFLLPLLNSIAHISAALALLMLAFIFPRLTINIAGKVCPDCAYPMVGIPSGVCPECGKDVRGEINRILGVKPEPSA